MMRLLAKSLLLVAVCGAANADQASLASLLKPLNLVAYRPGTATPRFSGDTLEGKPLSLADLRGKVVIVNFFASWCAECRPEMPVLEKLHREFAKQGLSIVGVNFQEDKETVGRYAHDLGLTFPLVLDPKGVIGTEYGVFGLPATFVVARDGRAVAFAVGIRDWGSAPALALIRTLLSEPAQAPKPTTHVNKRENP